MHNSPSAKHPCLLWVTELWRCVLVTETRGGSIWSPRDEREKTAMVERSPVEQWFSILQFDPTVSQYIICIVLSSGMEGRSKTILWCAILLLLHIYTQIKIARISLAQTEDVCISKKRIVAEQGEDVFCWEEQTEDEGGRSETISRCATTQPASTSSTDGSRDWKEAKKRNNGQNSIISSVFHVWEKGSKNFILGFIGDHSINLDCKF